MINQPLNIIMKKNVQRLIKNLKSKLLLMITYISQHSVISTAGRNLFNNFKDFSVASLLRNNISLSQAVIRI